MSPETHRTPDGVLWVHERRPQDDAECARLGCEDRTHPVWHRAEPEPPDVREAASDHAAVVALAWALAQRSPDGPHGSNELRRFRPLALAFLNDLRRDPKRAHAVAAALAQPDSEPHP